jgi:hypothetical protein
LGHSASLLDFEDVDGAERKSKRKGKENQNRVTTRLVANWDFVIAHPEETVLFMQV